jgi:EpsI family protein
MLDRQAILVPLFLLAQAGAVHWAAGHEHTPPPPSLTSFPQAFGQWTELREDPIAADMAGELGADRTLSRSYLRVNTGQVASLFVAWFQSQRSGTSQPHSPKVCLPSAGWTPAVTDEVTLHAAAGAIQVNRYIVVNRGQRVVVLYWYQGPRRVTAGEWESKLWLVADAIRDRRSDTALVRIVMQPDGSDDRTATLAATGFAENLYPLLQSILPR